MFYYFKNKIIDSESVAEKYYKMQDVNHDDYVQYHADTLKSIAKQYVPFVELGEELSKYNHVHCNIF